MSGYDNLSLSVTKDKTIIIVIVVVGHVRKIIVVYQRNNVLYFNNFFKIILRKPLSHHLHVNQYIDIFTYF